MWERLADPDPHMRELAADEAGDYLRRRGLDQRAVDAAVTRLVATAVADNHGRVQEAALHACLDAGENYVVPLQLFEPLVPILPRLPSGLLGYSLGLLGATLDPAARPIIAAYAGHPDPSVRADAADALLELERSRLPARGHRWQGRGVVDAEDEYLWLEQLDSVAALGWVAERNAEALSTVSGHLKDALLEVLDSKARIPYPAWRGDGFYYNFWTDADHPRGLWRRTTLEQYRRDEPEWDVLLDLDALNRAEGAGWTWAGANVLRPTYDRCLISLSRGGSDAVEVREFDLVSRTFVTGGFGLPEAKSRVSWIDADHVFVGTDFGPGSLTTSGYPRVFKRWRRGTPLAEAELVFEGEPDDVSVAVWHDSATGYERDFAVRFLDLYRSVRYERAPDGRLIPIEIPDDAGWEVHHGWLLIRPRTSWTVGDVTYPAGSLLVTGFKRGHQDLTVLFQPDAHTSLTGWAWTRDQLLLVTMTDVRTRVQILTPQASGWGARPIADDDEFTVSGIAATDPHHDDAYLISSEGFLRPATLSLDGAEILKREPAFFDADGMTVRQFFAESDDGTRVPYFVVGGSDGGPTLLTGYGGFEISMTPYYDGVIGRGWLARGGTYVVANIRGGGEYGPAWHRAARRENRSRAFEDFAAVAADLVARGITTPERLGIRGASNGGLLMGVMLTRYPELFGAIVASVPLLDMRRYAELLAGRSWVAEYGDPDVEADWAFLSEFSPYHQVAAGRPYPPVLLISSTRDDRVHPGHARKMTARLREYGYDATYYENVEGGHGAAADNDQKATVWALTLEFLWRRLHGQT